MKKISKGISISDGVAIVNGIMESITLYLNIKNGIIKETTFERGDLNE